MGSVDFDRAAGYYDKTRALPETAMNRLADLLASELRDRQPCLEIGVGTGRFALPLQQRGIDMVGSDISGAMLHRLVANAGGDQSMALLQSDATALPARAGTFGSVLAVHVLHLVPDWRIAVDEAVRVLRRGGALVASFPTDNRAAGSGRRDGAANDPARMGLRQEAGAPWAAVVRESARRHGMTRRQVGAHDPAAVAAYLGPRGTARELEPVPVRSVTTLGESITNIERQHFSWTWDHPAERAGAVAADVRAWAEREAVPLDTAHEADTASRWWVFELLP